MNLTKLLGGAVLLLIFVLIITLKIGGASELPVIVEQIGYCKLTYGEDYHLKENKLYCYNPKNYTDKFYFTYSEFRDVCPDHKFLSLKFYSNCFNDGGSRMNN